MKRITTMHLDVLTQKSEACQKECLFISHLHEGRIKLLKKSKTHQRYTKKYTQLAFMINPHESMELPKEVVNSIHIFHDKLKDINLEQDREKTVRLLKFMVIELNKTVKEWNRTHIEKQPIRLNLTITFVYGDHLVLLNFGHNLVYIYRDGDLSTFKGSRLNNEKHFSLKTGRDGKTEYLLFEKNVPPIGEVDFESSQIAVLFKLTHRLLKGDMLSIIAEKSISINKFRVNVNLFEHAIERPQMLRLMKQSVNTQAPGFAWILLTFDEVREFRQTVRYTLFRTLKGLFSFSIMLATLAAPSIYQQQLQVDTTPVQAFDTPATTAYVTLLDLEDESSIDLIPGISGSPEEEESDPGRDIEDPQELEEADPIIFKEADPTIADVSKRLSVLLSDGKYKDLASYHPLRIDASTADQLKKAASRSQYLSERLYGSTHYSELITDLNRIPAVNWIEGQTIYLPIFSSPYVDGRTLKDISQEFYNTEVYADYLQEINNLNNASIPYKKTIIIPPLEYFAGN